MIEQLSPLPLCRKILVHCGKARDLCALRAPDIVSLEAACRIFRKNSPLHHLKINTKKTSKQARTSTIQAPFLLKLFIVVI
jgi:hypothetical protein